MILTPTSGTEGDGTNENLENIVDITKKEELNILSENKITLDLVQDLGRVKLYNILDRQGKKIGVIDIHISKNSISIADTRINEEERNKGYGKMIYKEVVRLYKLPLISCLSSPEADRVRESLIREGSAYIGAKGERILKIQNKNQFKDYSVKNENEKMNNKKIVEYSHLDEEELNSRKNIEKFLKDMVGKDTFNLGKIVDYHIFTEGVSSIVAKIMIEDGKEYIFKSCNNFITGGDNKTHIEAKSFDIRRKYGVKTPMVYQESSKKFNGREIPYIIMEYIKPTRRLTEENEQEIAYEIGENIAKISKSEGKGFGWIKKMENNTPIGEYDTMEKYYDELEKRIIKNLTEKNLIAEKEKIKFHKAIQTIKNDFNSGTKAALNHEDVRFDNIFLTEPITIFDPNIRLDHPLMDLATTEYYLLMKNTISGDKKDVREKNLWEGYEKTTGKKIDKNIFNACLTIKFMQKIGIIYRYPEGGKRVQKALEILEKTTIKATE